MQCRISLISVPAAALYPFHTHFVFQAGNIANISSTLVNLALILLMGQVYTALAEQLTKWGRLSAHIRPHKGTHAQGFKSNRTG